MAISERGSKKGLVTVSLPSFHVGAFIGAAWDSIAAHRHTAWEVVVDDHDPRMVPTRSWGPLQRVYFRSRCAASGIR